MDETLALELAIRSERKADLLADGVPFPVRTVLDNVRGTFVFPLEPAALTAEECVLWIPEERHDALQVLVRLEPIDGEREASADRWRIYHGSPDHHHWASAEVLAVRFGAIVASAEEIDLSNPLAGAEPGLCKRFNADRARLGRAARAMDPRAGGEGLMVGVDPLGFDVRTRFDAVRVPFGERTSEEAVAAGRIEQLLGELAGGA